MSQVSFGVRPHQNTMMENESPEEQIRQFVSGALSVKPERLNPETRIGHDLGVDGDDGVEFMQAFAVHFGVDLADFERSQHFGPEAGCNPLYLLYYYLFAGARSKFVPITLADLVHSVQEEKWRMPSRDAV